MNIFIRGTGLISPQITFNKGNFLDEILQYKENYLLVVDPGYKNYLDPKLSRRMSKIIKMGVSAAKICLGDAGIEMPGAVIVGTGLGCIEDTENFLSDLITHNEQLLAPTAFIQSTHNTVAAQIALMLKCNETNFTYVHRGISFELALHDAIMQLNEKTADNILVGGVDELTQNTFLILKRLGLIKNKPISNLDLYIDKNKGTVYGEAAGFFVLSTQQDKKNYAEILALKMLHHVVSESEIENFVHDILQESSLNIGDIQLVIGGMNGDSQNDRIYDFVKKGFLKENIWLGFKHLCGEFHTASVFAFWLAVNMLKEQRIPDTVFLSGQRVREIKNILILNRYPGGSLTGIILQAC